LESIPQEEKRPQKRVKTVLRTIRVSEDLEATLEKMAAEKGIAMNALVSSALTKYALWDYLTERFGFVTISKSLFKDMIDSADPAKLQEMARAHRPQALKDMMMFWFQDISMEKFLEFWARRGRYGQDVKVEIKREGNNLTLIVTHDFGRVYTEFMRTALDEEFRTLFKIVPTIDTTESSVMVKATIE